MLHANFHLAKKLMNVVSNFLAKNWYRFGLERFGPISKTSCVIATPRFRASKHVIFFVLAGSSPQPILVAKVPRLFGEKEGLDREAANLKEVQLTKNGGFGSIPRVIAYEEFADTQILVETALAGQKMSSSLVQRKPKDCIEAVNKWLVEFHLATAEPSDNNQNWFDRLITHPHEELMATAALSQDELQLIEQTQEFTSVLRNQDIPLVFEHRDLGHPNILLGKNGDVGVVDWELGEPKSLPGVDLIFFLTLIGFARRGATTNADYLQTFREAFFGRSPWAGPYVRSYAEKLNLSPEAIKPLFILCWSRYVANIVSRLKEVDRSKEVLEEETLAWLRTNRYYALWWYAVNHQDEILLSA